MKAATELRIGNLCMDYYGHVFEVVELSQDTVSADDKLYKQNDVFGIPLTEEWLIKFGYKYSDVDGFWLNPDDEENIDITLRFVQSNDKFYEFHSARRVQYLHEAQNFKFALTGEELTIT